MAERRMFAKTIIDSDAFLDMPLSTQALYFHLSMRADDEGFVNNPRKIQRMIGAADDDLKVLITKKFIIPFDSGIVVIKHWKIHNYIRGDRLKGTAYQDEAAQLETKDNGAYTLRKTAPSLPVADCPSSDGQLTDICLPNDSIGKDRIDKERKGQERLGKADYQLVADMYNEICISFPALRSLSDARKKAIKARLKTYTIEDFQTLFEKAEASSFLKGANDRNWTATFDWLIKDSNMAKVLDGNYDNKPVYSKGKPTNKTAEQLDSFYNMASQWAEND